MIDAKQIPDEVLKVLGKELPGYEHNTKTICYALAAALNAWPGVWECKYHGDGSLAILLPLPKDAADE
jgi:hypothetical protein